MIVGGGIVGLAVGRRLLELFPGTAVTIIEKESSVGAHQTGHNSGVVHAGVYYPNGSLKAQLCTRGRQLLKEGCEQWDLPYVECGKLVFARDPSELPALRRLEQRARANGVPGLRWLEGTAITDVEPYVRGVAALHSPYTAIVDFRWFARRLADDVEERAVKFFLVPRSLGSAPMGAGSEFSPVVVRLPLRGLWSARASTVTDWRGQPGMSPILRSSRSGASITAWCPTATTW